LFPWAPRRAQAMEFEVVKPEVLEGLRARDDAASFKCKGGACALLTRRQQQPVERRRCDDDDGVRVRAGMMDCDGDRREFAKQQQQDFAKKLAEKQEAEKKPANKEG
jgi:hypothetical protein